MIASVILLFLALVLIACQPPSNAPDAQSPKPQIKELRGDCTFKGNVEGHEVNLSIKAEDRPGGKCYRVDVGFDWFQIKALEHNCETPAKPEPDASPTPDAPPAPPIDEGDAL